MSTPSARSWRWRLPWHLMLAYALMAAWLGSVRCTGANIRLGNRMLFVQIDQSMSKAALFNGWTYRHRFQFYCEAWPYKWRRISFVDAGFFDEQVAPANPAVRLRGVAVPHRLVAAVGFAGLLPGMIRLLAVLRIRSRRNRAIAASLCPRCGYDLRASVGSCPECGGPIDFEKPTLPLR